MEKMPIATTDTASIKQKKTYQLPVKQSVNGISVPIPIKNDIKTPVIMKKYSENHRKNLFLDSCH